MGAGFLAPEILPQWILGCRGLVGLRFPNHGELRLREVVEQCDGENLEQFDNLRLLRLFSKMAP